MRRALSLGLVALVAFLGCSGNPETSIPTPTANEAPSTAPTESPETPVPSGTPAPAPAPAKPACFATDPRATPVKVWVLPEAGETPYLDFLASAQKTIRVFGYQMGVGGILEALKAKAQAGLDVRVILDGNTQRDVNDKYRIQLEGAGVKFQWSDPQFSYMHAKTMVVDDREALVSTGNYSRSYMLKERNYVAKLSDPQDVGDLGALFDADWNKTPPNLACTRMLVSPVNAEPRLVELVKSAQKTLLIESMQYADRAVVDAVLERKAAGVDVRVLLAAPSWIETNTSAGADLVRNAIPARWLATPGVHVKSIVVDGVRAYLGSENLSYTSLTKNREIGLVLSDAEALGSMTTTFETDWAKATPF